MMAKWSFEIPPLTEAVVAALKELKVAGGRREADSKLRLMCCNITQADLDYEIASRRLRIAMDEAIGPWRVYGCW